VGAKSMAMSELSFGYHWVGWLPLVGLFLSSYALIWQTAWPFLSSALVSTAWVSCFSAVLFECEKLAAVSRMWDRLNTRRAGWKVNSANLL